MRQRRLVLTNEVARHPLRQRMPRPSVIVATREGEDGDVKLFLLSFAAFFTAFYSFVA